MYNILINYKLGNYVKDAFGKIYEITRISLDIVFDSEIKKDVVIVNLELIDAKEPWSNFYYILPADKVRHATSEEVDNYIYNGKSANGFSTQTVGVTSVVNSTPKQAQPKNMLESNDSTPVNSANTERTVDDILDEVNACRFWIDTFGDETGEYQQKIEELAKEFKEKTKKDKSNKK